MRHRSCFGFGAFDPVCGAEGAGLPFGLRHSAVGSEYEADDKKNRKGHKIDAGQHGRDDNARQHQPASRRLSFAIRQYTHQCRKRYYDEQDRPQDGPEGIGQL